MKFIATADLHLTEKQPANRKDNYPEVLLDKFDWICAYTQQSGAKALLVAGDFFDRPDVPYWITRRVLESIDKYQITVIAIPGQHDLRYHVKGLENTPLGMLEQCGIIILSGNGINGCPYKIRGLGWDEKFSKPIKEQQDILLTHEMVLPSKEGLFPGHEGFETKRGIMKKYPEFNIIISGDNHNPHVWRNKKGQIQLNCGSICRKNKDQVDYKPSIWEIEIKNKQYRYTEVPIPIQPPADVFDFDRIEKEEHRQELKQYINEFIESLNTNTNTPDFKDNLNAVINEINPRDSVKSIIARVMEVIQ